MAQIEKSVARYLDQLDTAVRPAGERLVHRFTCTEHGRVLHHYWTAACPTCPIKNQCTPGKERRLSRWEHEDVLEAVQRRLDERSPRVSTHPRAYV